MEAFKRLVREISREMLSSNTYAEEQPEEPKEDEDASEEELELERLREEKKTFENILQEAINEIGEDVEK